MRNLKRLKPRFGEKGISNVVTALLLIAVGVAGVGIVGGVMSSMAPAGTVTEVFVTNTTLIASTNTASITIKNMGTSGVGPCGVQIYADATWYIVKNVATTPAIPVGGTVTFDNTNFSVGIASGNTYNARFATADGSFVKYFTILAQ